MKKLLLPMALLLGVASAAPKITPQSIIVNPVDPDLSVNVWLDRSASNGTPNYNVGDRITIYASVNADAYVYLFNVNPDGTIDQVLPNRFASGGNFVKANTTKQFPAPGDRFSFDVGGPAGLNKVLALASKTQLNLDQISTFKSGQAFATVNVKGQQQFAQALSIVVNPVPQDSWVTDVAFYNVAQSAPQQPTGPAGFAFCANEYQTCNFSGTYEVAYGTAGKYVTRIDSNGLPCNNTTFGTDPYPGRLKGCFIRAVQAAQPRPAQPLISIDITIRPFSNASDVRTQSAQAGSQTVFTSNSDLRSVYAYYHAELTRQGYSMTDSEVKRDKIEAKYAKGRTKVKLQVKQNGNRFEVDIKQDR